MSKKIISAAFVAAIFIFNLPAWAQSDSSAQFDRAKAFFDEAKYPEAILSFGKVLEQEPDNINANYCIAECYYKSNQKPKSLEYYNKAFTQIVALEKNIKLSNDFIKIKAESGKKIFELEDMTKEVNNLNKEHSKKLLKVLDKARKANKTAFAIELSKQILTLDPQCEEAQKAHTEMTGKKYDPQAEKQSLENAASTKKPNPAGKPAAGGNAGASGKGTVQLFNKTDMSGWSFEEGVDKWSVSNGEITGEAQFQQLIIVLNKTKIPNQSQLDIKFKMDSAIAYSGFIVEMDTEGKMLGILINEDGKCLLLQLSKEGQKTQELPNMKVLKKNQFNVLSIRFLSNSIEVLANNEAMVTIEAPMPTTSAFGLAVLNGSAKISEVSYTPID